MPCIGCAPLLGLQRVVKNPTSRNRTGEEEVALSNYFINSLAHIRIAFNCLSQENTVAGSNTLQRTLIKERRKKGDTEIAGNGSTLNWVTM